MNLTHLLDAINLNNPYLVQTAFALASLFLGMVGMVIGQRLATNGRLCILIGLGIGIGTACLFATPYGYLAPGWCAVFIVGFLAYNELTKIVANGQKKDAAKAANKP